MASRWALLLALVLCAGCATTSAGFGEQPRAVRCGGMIAVGLLLLPAAAASDALGLALDIVTAPIDLLVWGPDKAMTNWRALGREFWPEVPTAKTALCP